MRVRRGFLTPVEMRDYHEARSRGPNLRDGCGPAVQAAAHFARETGASSRLPRPAGDVRPGAASVQVDPGILAHDMGPKFFLKVQKDGKLVAEKEITARKTILGRGEGGGTADEGRIFLDDETVSFDHAQVQIRGEDVLIQDLKSRNRVLVNGQFINPGVFYRLRNGDLIEICAFAIRLEVRTPRVAPPIEPVPASVGPFSLAVLSSPAAVAACDFHAFQTLPDGRAGICIGTVSGKMEIREETASECCAALRIEAAKGGSPGEVLARLGASLKADPPTGNPVSAVFGILDGEKLAFRFASAGLVAAAFFNKAKPAALKHIPPDSGPLNSDGAPPSIPEKVVKFKDGDVLLLVTPGVLDSSFSPDHQETQQLRNVVREELIEAWSDSLPSFLDRLKARIGEVECKVGPFGIQGLCRVAGQASGGGVKAMMPLVEEAVRKHLKSQAPSRDLTVFAIEK